MPLFTLPAKPAIAAAIEDGSLPTIAARLGILLGERGYVLGSGGVQFFHDGSATIDADRDPSADWATFDPNAETATETTERTQRDQAKARYAALKAGTATNAQVQQVLAYLLRHEFSDLAP